MDNQPEERRFYFKESYGLMKDRICKRSTQSKVEMDLILWTQKTVRRNDRVSAVLVFQLTHHAAIRQVDYPLKEGIRITEE